MREPNYDLINECHRMIDFLRAWVAHEKQPDAYPSTIDTLTEAVRKLLNQAELAEELEQ